MHFETLSTTPVVSRNIQKFIAYFQIFLAGFFGAIIVFVWLGLAIAVLTGTTFSVMNIAGILVAQLLCVALIANFFVGGYKEKRKLLVYSEKCSELPGNLPIVTRRARKIIAFCYLILACLSLLVLALHWLGLLNELLSGTVLSAEEFSVILVCELCCVALVAYLFARGFNERFKLRKVYDNT